MARENLHDPELREKWKTQKSHMCQDPKEDFFNMNISQRIDKKNARLPLLLGDVVTGVTYSPFYTFLLLPSILP